MVSSAWGSSMMMRDPTPPPLVLPPDPDAPLNLSKPKDGGPVPATTPKLIPPNLLMSRAFLPYAGLPPHVKTTGKTKKMFTFYCCLDE